MNINVMWLRLLYKFDSLLKDYTLKRAIISKPGGGVYKGKERSERVIISLTTFSDRLQTVHICIQSLLRQSIKPDKIVLYLGDDVSENEINENLRKLCEYGLDISTGNVNIKPHKKYYFAMQQFPNDIVITVDDDIVYERDLVKRLLYAHRAHPHAVICRRGRLVMRDTNGTLLPYKKWDYYKGSELKERFDILPIGCGGVLYPPNCLDKQVFNIDDIKSLCLTMDDLWLRFMAVKKGTSVVCVGPFSRFMCELPETQKYALCNANLNGEEKNDLCIKRLTDFFEFEIDNPHTQGDFDSN